MSHILKIQEALYGYLCGIEELGNRVYFEKAPSNTNTYPYCVFHIDNVNNSRVSSFTLFNFNIDIRVFDDKNSTDVTISSIQNDIISLFDRYKLDVDVYKTTPMRTVSFNIIRTTDNAWQANILLTCQLYAGI